MRQIEAAHIAEFDPFAGAPKPLAGIQLGGLGRQTLQVEPLGRPIGQERLDDLTARHRRAIPDNDHPARHLPQHMLPEGHHVCQIDGAVLSVERACSLQRHGADSREMSAGPPCSQAGRLAYRRIGADDAGQGIEAGCIEEEEGVPLGLRPLLLAGQVLSRH